MPFRIYAAEEQLSTLDGAVVTLKENTARTNEAVTLQGVSLARHDEVLKSHAGAITDVKTDVASLAIAVAGLAERVATSSNRIAWTFTAFSGTTLGSLIVYLATK